MDVLVKDVEKAAMREKQEAAVAELRACMERERKRTAAASEEEREKKKQKQPQRQARAAARASVEKKTAEKGAEIQIARWTEYEQNLFEDGCILHGWGNWKSNH